LFFGKVNCKIPLFGFFIKRTCILVDRGCSKSRLFLMASEKVRPRFSVCIFPGGVPDDESLLDTFKDGASLFDSN
jgi:1-acyl-sn-glycerol-3-phosphate acyltransferase